MRFKREIAPRIEQLVQFFPALVLTGARQSGKTTLLREMFPDHAYASLDLPAEVLGSTRFENLFP
jgi:predicted AAA+ superfamily ATPase